MLDNLPPKLAQVIDEAQWHHITDGMSAAEVYHLVFPEQPPAYLKYLPTDPAIDLTGEFERLQWLRDKLLVPEVLLWHRDSTAQYLLMSEISGLTCSHQTMVNNPALTVQLLAQGLRTIHALDWQDCPFSRRNIDLITQCRHNMELGVVDESDFDEWWGQPVEALWDELVATQPAEPEDLVFVHGDACLPNFLVLPAENKISGFIDMGACGVGDRYVDLALTQRSIIYNLGEKWVDPFFEAYGLAPNEEKIHWYRLVDEFF